MEIGWGGYLAIASMAVSVAMAVSQKKPKAAPLDDALNSSATRGAYVPLIIGRHRLGPIFGWVQDATEGTGLDMPSPGSQPGFGKGAGGVPEPSSYEERALHLLCVGPASSLRAIYQNGETIWEGPISPATHPSGTTIGLANGEGSFTVYWGFRDDPVIPQLAADPAHGLSVSYPLVMKVVWDVKVLGQSRTWPRLEYEVECPCYSQIAESASELPIEADEGLPTWEDVNYDPPPPSQALTDKVRMFAHRIVSLPSGRKALLVANPYVAGGLMHSSDLRAAFGAGKILKISAHSLSALGNSLTFAGSAPQPGTSINSAAIGFTATGVWKYFWIRDSYLNTRVFGSPTANPLYFNELVIELGPEVTGNYVYNQQTSVPSGTSFFTVDSMGWVEPLESEGTDGVNVIHMLDQLLFAKRPYGAGKDRSKFDARSIEQAAIVLQNEKIRGGIQVKDGEGVLSVVATIMQDAGLLIGWDPQVGKNVMQILRYDGPENSADLPKEAILKAPEMTTIHGQKPVDTIAFTFKDRRRNYREEPLVVLDNGQISLYETQKARKVPIEVTCDAQSAIRMVPRREQEVLANMAALTFETNHATQMAVPGVRIRATETVGAEFLFRVMSVKRSIDSSKVILDTVIDNYGAPPTTSENDSLLDGPSEGALPGSRTAAEDLAVFPAIEVPRMLAGSSIGAFFPLGRLSLKTDYGALWASRDGSSYAVLARVNTCIVGHLAVDLPADGKAYDDDNSWPTTPVSVDFDDIEDLSLDLESWRAGRQLLVVGDEVIFLQAALGDSLFGLIRGRCGTRMQFHPAGTPFFVVLAHLAVPVTSPMFVPGKTLSYKAQAVQGSKLSDLALSTVGELAITGKAFTPIAPSAPRQASLRPDYDVADALTVIWNWHSTEFPRTGLGTQGFGSATGLSPVRGHFVVKVLDTDITTVLAEIVVTEPVLELSVVERALWGLDALPSWSLSIAAVEGSFTSTETLLTLYPA